MTGILWAQMERERAALVAYLQNKPYPLEAADFHPTNWETIPYPDYSQDPLILVHHNGEDILIPLSGIANLR